MDKINLIRAGIFLAGGLVSIIFRVRLNNFKNKICKKLGFKSKDERKGYVYAGIILMIISIILLVYSITH